MYTPKLKGLSYKDLQLAGMINGFNFDKYKLTPMVDEKEVRRIKRQQQIDAGMLTSLLLLTPFPVETSKIQDEIAQSAYKFGSNKFKRNE